MGKRKRDPEVAETGEATDAPTTAPDKRTRRVAKHIVRGKAQMVEALKRARQFERQKLGKREHKRPQGGHDDRKLTVLIATLKSLDLEQLAEHHLHKNIAKTKSIAKTGLLPEHVKVPENKVFDPVVTDLTSRLLKDKAVLEAFDSVMAKVRHTLGVDDLSKRALKRARQEEPSNTAPKERVVIAPSKITKAKGEGSRVEKDPEAAPEVQDHPERSIKRSVDHAVSDEEDALRDQIMREIQAARSSKANGITKGSADEKKHSKSEPIDRASTLGVRDGDKSVLPDLRPSRSKMPDRDEWSGSENEEDGVGDNTTSSNGGESADDYDSEDLAKFNDRFGTPSDDDSEEAIQQGNLASILRQELKVLKDVKSPRTKRQHSLDSKSDGRPSRANSLSPALSSHSGSSVLSITSKGNAAVRRLIPGHLGIRDPTKASLKTHLLQKQSPFTELENVADIETPLEKTASSALKNEKSSAFKSRSSVEAQTDGSSEQLSVDSSDSESAFDADSNSESIPKVQTKPPKSAFVPSLTMAGYLSGDESDATDVEDHIAPRKNRRGQRARQAIWEQKFKEQAKHLGKPKKSKGKNDGWDAKRGAVSSKDGLRGKKGKFGGAERKGSGKSVGASGASPAALGETKHRDDSGALHPSWQAKKAQKAQNLGVGGFQGKKITFD